MDDAELEMMLEMMWFDSYLFYNCRTEEDHVMASLDTTIASREKTVAMLVARIKEYEERAARLPAGSNARIAVSNLAVLDKQRLHRVRIELDALREAAAVDDRQVPVPGTEKKGR